MDADGTSGPNLPLRGLGRSTTALACRCGTVLNLINQGDAMLSGMTIDLTKLLLTYLVPYFVSTYGAVSYRLHAARLATQPEPALVR